MTAEGKPAVEIVATRGFMAELSDAEQQVVFKTWGAVLDCAHEWKPTPDGEQVCTRCKQRRVPSIEQTPGLVVIGVRPDRKVWVKRDEHQGCTCEPCQRAMLTSPHVGVMGVLHAEECECACPKVPLSLWTFLLPEEY